MPSQRPFFASFFSAFRARTSPTFQAKSSPTTGAVTSLTTSAHISNNHTTSTTVALPRTLTTRPNNELSSSSSTAVPTTTTAGIGTSTAQPIKITNSTPFAASAITSHSPSSTFYSHHLPIQVARTSRPSSPGPAGHGHGLALSPSPHMAAVPRGRTRRGSDSSSSSGGFMDSTATDKWYIGGRTAGGEERFYKLSLVAGAGSEKLRSLDRLSL